MLEKWMLIAGCVTVIVPIIIIGIVFALARKKDLDKFARMKPNCKKAVGEVTSVVRVPSFSDIDPLTFDAEYLFTADDGGSYTGVIRFTTYEKGVKKGDKLNVYYLPENPAENFTEIIEKTTKSKKWNILAIAIAVVAVIAILASVMTKM